MINAHHHTLGTTMAPTTPSRVPIIPGFVLHDSRGFEARDDQETSNDKTPHHHHYHHSKHRNDRLQPTKANVDGRPDICISKDTSSSIEARDACLEPRYVFVIFFFYFTNANIPYLRTACYHCTAPPPHHSKRRNKSRTNNSKTPRECQRP